MNFAIYLSFSEFVADIPAGSTVYTVGLTQTSGGNTEHALLLTSEAGTPGGTICVIRLKLELANDVVDVNSTLLGVQVKFKILLDLKGMTSRHGMVLTRGLGDALDHYKGGVAGYSLDDIDKLLAKTEQERAK